MKISNYNQFLLEKMGVPSGIIESATRLYDLILDKFKSCGDTVLWDGGGDLEYTILFPITLEANQMQINSVHFVLVIHFDDNVSGIELVSYGVSCRQTDVKDFSFAYGANKTSDKIEVDFIKLNMVFAASKSAKFSDIYNDLVGDRTKSIAILSHEIKHAYDKYMFGRETFAEVIDYHAWANTRSGIDAVDTFMYSLYVISQSENLVRPSEVAAEIETIGLTKTDFKEFLEGLRLYKELKFIKYWTYQKLKDDLKADMPNLRKRIKGIPPDEPDESIIDFVLQMTYESLTEEYSKGMENILGIKDVSNELMAFIKRHEIDFYKKYMSARTFNSYDKFFEYWQEKLNFEADKMIKKISKLYDMCKDDNVNPLMSKISGRGYIVNPKLHTKLVLSPQTKKTEKPFPTGSK